MFFVAIDFQHFHDPSPSHLSSSHGHGVTKGIGAAGASSQRSATGGVVRGAPSLAVGDARGRDGGGRPMQVDEMLFSRTPLARLE